MMKKVIFFFLVTFNTTLYLMEKDDISSASTSDIFCTSEDIDAQSTPEESWFADDESERGADTVPKAKIMYINGQKKRIYQGLSDDQNAKSKFLNVALKIVDQGNQS